MRKGFNGLAAEVENRFGNEVTSGAFFAFLNRKRDRIKVLYWDGDGLVIWYKQLEAGTFSCRQNEPENPSRREFLMLLEGVVPKRLKRRYKES